ncbi:MAG TPA: hypothetical protein VMW23_09565 [Sedimentisphaerales bacterium]|nr:hypothetical protein [Sedimentisphaerales bacterium]
MRWRDLIICSLCTIVAAGGFIIAGMRLDYISSQRREMKLISNEPLKNAPPSLAFATVAMGAFRGLVVDVLWMRAERLKEEGEFFDAKQLADWITTLQPRFAQVWQWQAWNMAYNISVCFPATQPQQRWRWVKNGYELLRDQGIAINPESSSLYFQLGMIFQHKIGSESDDVHKYYKLQLAEEMEALLGPATESYFDALADVTWDWRQIAESNDVGAFVGALRAADENFADADGDAFVKNYMSLRQNPHRFDVAAFNVIDRFRTSQALEKFDIFAKAYILRNVWKLEPGLMRQLNKTYGPVNWNDPNNRLPLDWRHADCHAIYWGYMGLQQITRDPARTVGMDETNIDRLILNSLQALFRYGKTFIFEVRQPASDTLSQESAEGGDTVVGPMEKDIFLRPDLRMFESYNQATLKVLEKYKNNRKVGYEAIQIGHRNMLINAAFSFYQGGLQRQAVRIYNQLRQLYPMDEFKVSLTQFIRDRLKEELQNLSEKDAREMIEMLLQESYFRYAFRDDNEAFSREKMAQEIYDRYQTTNTEQKRLEMPDFRMLRYFALLGFLNDAQYPVQLQRDLLSRIEIERPQLAEQLKQQQQQLLKQLKPTQ